MEVTHGAGVVCDKGPKHTGHCEGRFSAVKEENGPVSRGESITAPKGDPISPECPAIDSGGASLLGHARGLKSDSGEGARSWPYGLPAAEEFRAGEQARARGIAKDMLGETSQSPGGSSWYGGAKTEPVDLIQGLEFWRGSAIKYVFRAGKKPGSTERTDLEKARWYINRRLAELSVVKGE